MPEAIGDGAAGPIIGQRTAKSVVAMPAVSDSSDPRSETDSRSTLLEALIDQLRRLVVAGFPSQPLDVLRTPASRCASSFQPGGIPCPVAPLAYRNGILTRHPSPSAEAFASPDATRHVTTLTRIPVLST